MGFFDLFKSKKGNTINTTSKNHIKKSLHFPAVDEQGKKALTLREADIYGTGRTYSGVSAQDVVAKLNVGDTVILENSVTSDAVKVFSSQKEQFGFLPEWKDTNAPKVKYEVYSSLERGATVLAKVKSKYINKNGNIGVIIEVCRYSTR